MAELFIGSNGLSVWSSKDLGETLVRMSTGAGIYSGSQVWSLSAHSKEPQQLYIGTDTGIYVLDRSAHKCRHVSSPMNDMLVTTIAHSPDDPATIYAGTQPAGLFKSTDRGAHWRKLEVPMKPYVTEGYHVADGAVDAGASDPSGVVVRHWTRVTTMAIDPADPRTMLAGVEIDGVWRSTDGGERWQKMSDGLTAEDIHGLYLRRPHGSQKPMLYATTNKGLFVSDDMGTTWRPRTIDSPWQYVRSIIAREDSGVMFMSNGDGPPGTTGRLFRSSNQGEDWSEVRLPVPLDSSLYFFASNPANPSLIFVAANLGQIYRSTDGGETWTMLKRRLGEIRAMVWLPD